MSTQSKVSSIEDHDSLNENLAALNLSSPVAAETAEHMLTPRNVTPNKEDCGLITVRDLSNATPSPSSSPAPSPADRSAAGSHYFRPVGSDLQQRTAPIPIDSEQDLIDLQSPILQEEDPFPVYDVEKESLPPLPFTTQSYQNALKFGKSLVNDIYLSLLHTNLAANTDTQLNKIKKKAEVLSKFDNPICRRIGIVGDSAAGL